jgi:pSer/pThr/pTyr-binding forkhead associated (FHA) protein
MALLVVLDDGDDEGETIRIRASSFVIGRVEGDLVIPHDPGISGRHAEILRRPDDGQGRWHLKDLNSTNGTFVRTSSALLQPNQEILLGARRYRFDPARPADLPSAASADDSSTRKWQSLSPTGLADLLHPTLVELTPQGEGPRFRLAEAENWVGRDPRRCSVVLDHPMISPRHARIQRDDRGRWWIHNAKSRNGVWLRVHEIPLERGGQFQCGEQRFLVKIL